MQKRIAPIRIHTLVSSMNTLQSKQLPESIKRKRYILGRQTDNQCLRVRYIGVKTMISSRFPDCENGEILCACIGIIVLHRPRMCLIATRKGIVCQRGRIAGQCKIRYIVRSGESLLLLRGDSSPIRCDGLHRIRRVSIETQNRSNGHYQYYVQITIFHTYIIFV